ncbi:MAG TPA: ORF6N domain-containing protein [bacterium]|jgi:phage regulator Rha-like protein|nr:ORF6N domain-containing protein [bacterium]
MSGNELIKVDDIRSRIFTIRGMQVMIDSDLAELYGVETKNLNLAVKRNIERFPVNFRFQLTEEEYKVLRLQIETSNEKRGGRRYAPFVFTEQGVAMLSAVLRSETAIKVSIRIMEAFVSMRHFILENEQISKRFEIIEKRQMEYKIETDSRIEKVLSALESKQIQPKQGIFFDGQVFDAHKFVSDIVRSAEKSIILIDNYVDDTVLTLFSKRKQGVTLKILTKNLSKQIQLDMQKFNEQFPPAEIIEFNHSHDRFMIIDNHDLYLFGASLKDLGRKWFGFAKMDIESTEILAKLGG